MSTTTLVFGAHGQLGSALCALLDARGHDLVALTREGCDVTDPRALHETFARVQPGLVFNATAYNLVDAAEGAPDDALALNALAPAQIAALCRQHGATLMHFSTDYVFGPGHTRPIDESQQPAPCSVYGRSKWLGEQLVARNCPASYVVRCCGLYSARRANFIQTMLRHGLAGRPLRVVHDQHVSPTWVQPLARVAVAITEREVFGTYHAVAHGGCTWYEYAKKIFEVLGVEVDLEPTTQAEYGAPAPRPGYSVLDNALLRLQGLDDMAPWDEALELFLVKHGEALLAAHAPSA